MREPRNPFRLRSSEHIHQDATFLKLFEPGILDVFSTGNLWSGVRLIRSAAGAGEDVAPPGCLRRRALDVACEATKQDDWTELYQRLRELGAVDEPGPRVLGVMLQCGRYYAALADLSRGQFAAAENVLRSPQRGEPPRDAPPRARPAQARIPCCVAEIRASSPEKGQGACQASSYRAKATWHTSRGQYV